MDITNYVLWTTGQPLHAFDLDKIAGAKIYVRFAKDGEEMVTIDGIKRKLSPDVLVIADQNKDCSYCRDYGRKRYRSKRVYPKYPLRKRVFLSLGCA